MTAAVVNYAREAGSVEVRPFARPKIGADDVLVEVAAVGVCGSDLHQWTSSHSWPVNYPVVLGHEFAGTVVETGSNVRNWSEGDRVASETAAVIDLDNPMSRRGLYNLDPNSQRVRVWCRRRDDAIHEGARSMFAPRARRAIARSRCADRALLCRL